MAADLPSSFQPLPSGFDLGSAVNTKVCKILLDTYF